ncbi:MAG: energy transducer TonB [Burkholderiales bacterium]|nr:energy transducer TonB [Burkholderiales bacterium]
MAGLTPALAQPSEIGALERRALVFGVGLAHLAGAWALLQVDAVRAAAHEIAPLVVDLVAPPAPPVPPPPVPPPPLPRVAPPPPPPAPLLAAPPAPTPVPETFATPAPPPDPVPAPPEPVPAPVVQAVPAPPPPAPPRKVVPATAVEYLRLPPVEVPRLSRRAGESGTVWLRVVVDVRGQPLQVSVQRSSGHARLDEQALWAMRQARFKPQTENGQPVELEVTAPIEYTLE